LDPDGAYTRSLVITSLLAAASDRPFNPRFIYMRKLQTVPGEDNYTSILGTYFKIR
jgi:hypothetical protein